MFKFRNKPNSVFNLFSISKSDRHDLCEYIIDSSAPKSDFYFLVILSTLIVSLGLVANNVILVIGGMLVTPLLSPILAISLGLVITNLKVFIRSFRIVFVSFFLSVLVSFITGYLVEFNINNIDLIKIMEPSIFTLVVAFIAGLAASFTWAKPELSNTLPGVAITVTLIPPITAIGLSIAAQNLVVLQSTFYVLLINIFGIIAASILILLVMGFYKEEKKVLAEIKEEEKELSN